MPTYAVGQDANGFLWVGTIAGLCRFDGHRMLPWGREEFAQPVWRIYSGPRGDEVLFGGPEDNLFRVTEQSVELLLGPGGKPFKPFRDAAFAGDSSLFVAMPNMLYVRAASAAAWKTIALPPGVEPFRLGRAIGGSVLIACGKRGLWRSKTSGTLQKLRDGWIDAAVELDDSAIYYSERYPADPFTVHLFSLRNQHTREIYAWRDQYPRLITRGRSLWMVDTSLIAKITPDDRLEQVSALGEHRGAASGFLDGEGSLWVATGSGLVQFPEPDIELWNERDGLPGDNSRYINRTAEGLWISTWQGLRLLRTTGRTFEEASDHQGQLCVDRDDVLWAGAPRIRGRFDKSHEPPGAWLCAASGDGTVWLSIPEMYHAPVRSLIPARVPLPKGSERGSAMSVDSRGRVWFADDELVCWANGEALDAGLDDAWQCSQRHGCVQVQAMREMPSGEMWVATYQDGLWSFDTKVWKQLPGSLRFPSRFIANLAPSRRGGVWILTPGSLIRVNERRDLPDGFEVMESLSASNGMSSNTFDILEEPKGALWLSSGGATYIPASVRDRKPHRPNVLLTSVAVTGRTRQLGARLEVPPGPSRVDIDFAVLSYRDRSSLRYQYRLKPDLGWQNLASNEPVLRLIDLQPGDYTISLRSSLDGREWGEIASPVMVHVLRVWYLRTPYLVVFSLVLIALLAIAYHIRLKFLLGLERERNRIAMDLHDELGTGLGSIGILSGVAASELATEPQRREMLQKISANASELSVALGEMLWSLKGGRGGLNDLLQRIVRRAETLFPSDIPKFEFRSSPVPVSAQLNFEARRNLMLLADEALHNTARHAHAQNVLLALQEVDGEWEIRLEDDGVGIRKPENGGMGIANMRRRAAAIGARIWFENRPEGGCRVRIRFLLEQAGKDPL